MPAKGRRFDSIHVNRTHNQRILFGRIERRTQARRAGELTTTMRSWGVWARSDVQTFQVFFFKELWRLWLVNEKWLGWKGRRPGLVWSGSEIGLDLKDPLPCDMRVLLAIPRHWLFSVSVSPHSVSRADASTWSFLSLWAGNDQAYCEQDAINDTRGLWITMQGNLGLLLHWAS